MTIYYVYKLTHKTDNTFYFGSHKCSSHYSNILTFDLGIKYKSSSQTIKNIGFDNFNYEIIKSDFESSDDCYWAEQLLIKQHINNTLCLNKHYMDINKHSVFSTTGSKLSDHHKKLISETQKGRPRTINQIAAIKNRNSKIRTDNIVKYNENPKKCMQCDNAMPYDKRNSKTCSKDCRSKYQRQLTIDICTAEYRQKLSDARKNVIYTDEWRRNMSLASKGKHKTEEHKQKLRKLKGPNPGTSLHRKNALKLQCEHCGKFVDSPAMHRWHGLRCKNYGLGVTVDTTTGSCDSLKGLSE